MLMLPSFFTQSSKAFPRDSSLTEYTCKIASYIPAEPSLKKEIAQDNKA